MRIDQDLPYSDEAILNVTNLLQKISLAKQGSWLNNEPNCYTLQGDQLHMAVCFWNEANIHKYDSNILCRIHRSTFPHGSLHTPRPHSGFLGTSPSNMNSSQYFLSIKCFFKKD